MTDKLDELAIKYCKDTRPLDWTVDEKRSFIAGYKASDEEIEKLKDRVDWLRGELRGIKSKESK